MSRRVPAIIASFGLLLAAGAASAADNGIYFGASLGDANVEIDQGLAQIDASDTGFKLIAGIRPLDWFGVEVNYVNFGEPEQGPLAVDADGFTGSAVFFLPVGPVDVFAKGGIVSWDGSVDIDGGGGTLFQEDGTDLAYGIGAQFRVWSLSIRAEYEIFDLDDVEDANMLSLGVTFTFL
jgi:Outer membrane protein beta-barrel domain